MKNTSGIACFPEYSEPCPENLPNSENLHRLADRTDRVGYDGIVEPFAVQHDVRLDDAAAEGKDEIGWRKRGNERRHVNPGTSRIGAPKVELRFRRKLPDRLFIRRPENGAEKVPRDFFAPVSPPRPEPGSFPCSSPSASFRPACGALSGGSGWNPPRVSAFFRFTSFFRRSPAE